MAVSPEPGSFRDRSSQVFYVDGEVRRGLNPRALEEWETLQKTAFYGKFAAAGRLVATQSSVREAPWAAVLRHERIPFVSYPHEWTFGMLKDAALLHLDLMSAALGEGMIVKDSSPENIQWRGSQPVFIDLPSFVRWPEGRAWEAYLPFCRLFLFPLLLSAHKGVAFQPWLRGEIAGIDPGTMRDLFSLTDIFRKGLLAHVFVQAKLQTRMAGTKENVRETLENAGFSRELIRHNVAGLRRIIESLAWEPPASAWSGYAGDNSYSEAAEKTKRDFVREAVHSRKWKLAWDLGSNSGEYARVAAENADAVVAMDADPAVVEKLYRALRTAGDAKILALVINLADPSPALGWRGQERKALTDRAKPDLVLALALIHHIVIGANIRLADFIAWLAELNASLVIEYVAKEDPMVRVLLSRKDDQYDDYSPEAFERALGEHFTIAKKTPNGTRTLYFAIRK